MQFQFDISTANQPKPAVTPGSGASANDLLRHLIDLQRDGFTQLIELQREQLAHARHVHQEHIQRWKNVLGRWAKDFPDLAGDAKKVYPRLERVYLNFVQNLVTDLMDQGEDGFDSEFALQEFLDRHGMRVSQLGHLLGLIGPLSEAGNNPENSP